MGVIDKLNKFAWYWKRRQTLTVNGFTELWETYKEDYKNKGKTILKAKNKKILEENKNKKVISLYGFNGEYMNLNEVLNILTTTKNKNPNKELIVAFKTNKDNNCEMKIKG